MSNARRHPHVAHVDEVPARSVEHGARFGATMRHLGVATGAKGIGATMYEVAPGRTAFPRHFHCANEEALFVLEGQGTLRIGDAEIVVGSGDYATFPVGPDHAHQLVNSGTTPLRYLCLSTLSSAEVVGYPDSKKIGAMATPSLEAARRGEFWVRHVSFESSAAAYYEGEDAG